jgi:ketosteroid isomerase-like protein
MRTGFIIVAVGILIAACSGTGQEKTDAKNLAVVEKYIQAVQSKDTQTMTELLADDYVGYGPSVADTINKAQAIANWKYVADSLYEKIEYTRTVNITAKLTDGPNQGDYVSDWASLKIKYIDVPEPVILHVNAVYRIKDGKINLSRTFYNEADVLRQLGYSWF